MIAKLRERQSGKPTQATLAQELALSRSAVRERLAGRVLAESNLLDAVLDASTLSPESREECRSFYRALILTQSRLKAGESNVKLPTVPEWLENGDGTLEGSQSASSDDEKEQSSEKKFVRSWRLASLVALALAIVATAGLYWSNGKDGATADSRHQELVANRNGAGTFGNPLSKSGATGPRIPAFATVSISCKVYAPTIQSSVPDGYWYRVYSPPWSDQFYAVANVFANGDNIQGPYTHNTDFSVPNC